MFFSKRAVEDHIADWVEDRFAILLEHFSQEKPVHETELALPTDERFKVSGDAPEARARTLFAVTAELAGFAGWPVKLVAMGDDGPKQVSDGLIMPSANTAAGTFSVDETGEVQITFARELLSAPVNLTATFAHELAHLLLHARGVEEGIGAEDAELVTDLGGVYLGFGVFMANAAFELEQFQDGLMGGWSSRRQGYLTENTLVYATALFCAIKDDGFEDARAALKPRLQAVFDRALKQISRRGDHWSLFDLDRHPPQPEG